MEKTKIDVVLKDRPWLMLLVNGKIARLENEISDDVNLDDPETFEQFRRDMLDWFASEVLDIEVEVKGKKYSMAPMKVVK